MKRNKLIVDIIVPYIFWFSIFLQFYVKNTLNNFSTELLLWLVFIVCKDIYIYFTDIKTLKTMKIDYSLLKSDNLKLWPYIIILNRKYIFPILLVLYIIILLIVQTKIFGLDKLYIVNLINQNVLLAFVAISWIITIFRDEIEKKYELEIKSPIYTGLILILVFVLSILGTYIILTQTLKLWVLAYLISFISWILIFLVGILVLEEDDDNKNLKESIL